MQMTFVCFFLEEVSTDREFKFRVHHVWGIAVNVLLETLGHVTPTSRMSRDIMSESSP